MQRTPAAVIAATSTIALILGHARAESFNVASGNWGVAANWSPADVPNTPSEVATVTNGGTVTLDANYSFYGLTMGNGSTVTGNYNLTVATLTMPSGYVTGTGTLTVTGPATFAGAVPGPSFGRTVNLQGATTVSGNGFGVYNNATLTNSGTISLAGDTFIQQGTGTNNILANTGTLTKTSGTGTASVTLPTVNTGTISSQSGVLAVTLKSFATSTGTFTATSATTPLLLATTSSQQHYVTSATTFNGAGTIALTGGHLWCNSGTATASPGIFEIDGGGLDGNWSLSNLLMYSGGLGYSATTSDITVTGPATLAPRANTSLTLIPNTTLRLNGATTLSGTTGYGLNINYGATVSNTGTFSVTDDSGTTLAGNGNFNNSGTLKKTGGTGTSTFYNVTNTGTVSAQSGTLRIDLNSSANSTGNFNAASGATLQFDNGGTLTNAATITGAGTFKLTYGVLNTTGGTVAASPATFSLEGGQLSGNWNLSNLTWTNGYMSGGNVTVTGPASISIASFGDLDGHTLTLQNTTTLSGGTKTLYIANTSTLNNAGTFNIADDSSILGATSYVGQTSVNTFNNTGTLAKTGGTGASTVQGLVNSGTVSAQSGTLAVQMRDASTAAGTFSASGGATLGLSYTGTGPHTLGGGVTLSGAGRFAFSGAPFVLAGTLKTTSTTYLDVPDTTASAAADVTISGTVADQSAAGSGLTKGGAGTLLLSGGVTTTGAFAVADGTLRATPTAYATLLGSTGGVVLRSNTAQLVFDYTASTTPAASVRAKLAAAYPSNFASGQLRFQPGSGPTPDRGLGYADDGTSVVTVKPALYGDANLDGGVTIADFNALAAAFNTPAAAWTAGDFNYDGVITIADFNLLAANFNRSLLTVSAGPNAAALALWGFAVANDDVAGFEAATGVPEPGALVATAVAAGLTARRRPRRAHPAES